MGNCHINTSMLFNAVADYKLYAGRSACQSQRRNWLNSRTLTHHTNRCSFTLRSNRQMPKRGNANQAYRNILPAHLIAAIFPCVVNNTTGPDYQQKFRQFRACQLDAALIQLTRTWNMTSLQCHEVVYGLFLLFRLRYGRLLVHRERDAALPVADHFDSKTKRHHTKWYCRLLIPISTGFADYAAQASTPAELLIGVV